MSRKKSSGDWEDRIASLLQDIETAVNELEDVVAEETRKEVMDEIEEERKENE